MRPVHEIPGYDLLRCLGGGPLTAVYSARDGESDTLCAVKVLREEWADQPTAIKLLQREARAGLAVHHPHLVRIRHAHVMRSPYFLVMDWLPGVSLAQRLRRDYRVELPTALWITRQTAEALYTLHRAGFVHGDVKPDNVRLVDDGTAVLIDLGFAHRPGENAALFREGYVLGTVDYLAPERGVPGRAPDQARNLSAPGVPLSEMLPGVLPYPAGTVEQTIRRHYCDPPADVRRHAPHLPPALVTLTNRLLARRPAD